MRKIVIVQIVLASIAFLVTAWIFFRVRPHEVETHELQQKLEVAEQKIEVVQEQNKQLEVAVKAAPSHADDPRSYRQQGVSAFHQGDYRTALTMYDKALERSPNDAYVWSLKGYTLYRAGKIGESIEANKKAVQLNSRDPLNFIDLAKSYCAAKRFADAERTLTTDPTPEVGAAVRRYVLTDGEIQRVCRQILPLAAQKEPGDGKEDAPGPA